MFPNTVCQHVSQYSNLILLVSQGLVSQGLNCSIAIFRNLFMLDVIHFYMRMAAVFPDFFWRSDLPWTVYIWTFLTYISTFRARIRFVAVVCDSVSRLISPRFLSSTGASKFSNPLQSSSMLRDDATIIPFDWVLFVVWVFFFQLSRVVWTRANYCANACMLRMHFP